MSTQAVRAPSTSALEHYLTLQYVPGPRTMLSAIRKLPPGHMLVWQDGQTTIQRYWDIVLAAGDRRVSETHAVEEFDALLDETIRLHRISDVPIGVLLSGGPRLERSDGAARARARMTPADLTVGFEWAGASNELAEAEVVARTSPRSSEVVMAPRSAMRCRASSRHSTSRGGPRGDPDIIRVPVRGAAVEGRATGEGGDELMGGYPRYRW